MRINIVAGGPKQGLPLLQREPNEMWIAVDRGFDHLVNQGIVPDIVIGDFDSISGSTGEVIKDHVHMQFPAEKDETDLELALTYAIEQNPESVIIYGATGGRLDHELINIQLLKKGLNRSTEMYIVDRRNKLSLKAPGNYEIFQSNYRYISFLSLYEKVENLSLQFFKYPLNQATLYHGSSLCVSNQLISNKGTYSFSRGILMVIESSD